MASASSTSAKNLFVDSKLRLVERVQTNINSVGSICRQIVRGSKSTELVTQASKNLSQLEQSIENTEDNVSRLKILTTHLDYQYQAIEKSCQSLEEAKEQIRDMQRGAEKLFDDIQKTEVDLKDSIQKFEDLLIWLRYSSGFFTPENLDPELFFVGKSVKPGIIVLVNDVDWELLDELMYQLKDGDHIVFISTLHGGLEPEHKEAHKLLWETFTENRKPDRIALSFKLIEDGHLFPAAKQKRQSYEWYIPKGILKTNWIPKYLKIVPSLMVVFADLDWSDPKWNEKRLELSQSIQLLKTSLVGRNTRLAVVLMQSNLANLTGEVSGASEKAANLCANCDLTPKNLFVLPQVDSHLLGYVTRLESALNDIACGFYLNEIKCIKSHKDFLNKTNHHILFIRHQFKLGFHNEMRNDQTGAMKHYAQCYQLLHEHRITNTNLHEVRIVASMVNYKLCQLNFMLSFPRDAIEQFKRHIDLFRQRTGSKELIFEHYAWLSKQYETFAEIFLNAVKNGLSSVQTLHPGLYYEQAAKHAVLRRNLAVEMCKGIDQPHEEMLEGWDKLEFYGQRPWRSGKHLLEPPEVETESIGVKAICFYEIHHVNHTDLILPLFSMAITQFQLQKCPRIKKHLMVQMAREYVTGNNAKEALALLNHVMWDYRSENWTSLLASCSFLALQCALQTGSICDYLSNCLEIIGKHIKATEDEKERVFQNFLRIINGDDPMPEPNMDSEKFNLAMSLWREVDRSSITVDMSVLLPCIEVRASFDHSSSAVDGISFITVKIRSHLKVSLQLLRVTVKVSSVGDISEVDENKIIIKANETLCVSLPLYPDISDLGSKIQIESVTLGLGSWSQPIMLQWTGGGDQGTVSHRQRGQYKEFQLVSDDFNDSLTTELEVVNRNPLMEMDLEYDSACLIWEWLPIKINLKNSELTSACDVKLSLSLDHNSSSAFHQTTQISTQANLESKLVLSSISQLNLGAFEVGEERSQLLYVKVLTAAKRNFKLEMQYSSVVNLKGKKTSCPSSKIHKFSLQSKMPFQINISTQSLKFEPISRVAKCEKFVVVPQISCMAHVPITFVQSSIVVGNGVQLCGTPTSQVVDVELEANEEATDCFPLMFSKDLTQNTDIQLGQYMLYWKRTNDQSPVVSVSVSLPTVSIEDCGIWVETRVPSHGRVRVPLSIAYDIQNTSDTLKEVVVNMQVSDAFMFSGHREVRFRILPGWHETVTYTLYPLVSGHIELPHININSEATGTSTTSMSDFLSRILPSHVFIMPQGKSALEGGMIAIVAS